MMDHEDFLVRACGPQTFQSREQRVHGLVTAKVDRIEDDGTYRLRFFGMNGQPTDPDFSPARVMMPMAGGKRGTYFFPEPGDEVVVAFVVGDTNQPIILGAVWNHDDRPPDQAKPSTENNVRTIVSRSGHEITLDDTAGAEKVTVRTQGGHEIVLDDAPAAPKITVATMQGRTLVLDDTPPGSATLETPTCQLTMSDAAGSISIEATAEISIKAPLVTIDGTVVQVGTRPGAAVVDGKLFQLHNHVLSGGPSDGGPVAP